MPPPPPPLPEAGPMRFEGNESTMRRPEEINTLTVVMNVVTTVTHMLLGAVAISAFIFNNGMNLSSHLAQHIYLCVIGYVILMSQAILTFSPYNGWANTLKYPDKKLIHWVMQVVGSILAILGSIIRIANVNQHFQTAHGILGLIALILTMVSLFGGAMKLIFQKQLSGLIHKSLHICIGILTLCVSFLCLCFGFHTLYRTFMGDINANLSISFTIISMVGVIASASMNMIKRFVR